MANYKQLILGAMIIGLVVAAPRAEAALTCGALATGLAPCINYIRTGGTGVVPAGCCNGIRNLNNSAKTTPDRQTVCKCLKQASNTVGTSVNIKLAAGIPGKCGVNIPYKLDPSIDCSKVH